MKNRLALLIVLALCLSVFSAVSASPVSDTTTINVVEDEYVVYQLEDFPANDVYYVYMGQNGTNGLGGILVSKLATNKGGTFLAKFFIPDELKGEEIINIRFESQNGRAAWWNYFYNATSSYSPPTTSATKTSGSTVKYNVLNPGTPRIDVLEVVQGSSITIRTKYFPADQRWAVFIKDGAMANNDWIEVQGFESAEGGIMTMTIAIPSSLKYKEKLAIKIQSLKTDEFWFPGPIVNRDYP